MSADSYRRQFLQSVASLGGGDTFAVRSPELNRAGLRLQSEFYGSSGYRAVRAMIDSGFHLEDVGQYARVIWFGPFSRNYVEDPTAGVPFLSSSEIMEAKLKPKNYLSRALTPKLDRLIVSEGTILVSCSGTIGNVAYVGADMDGMAVSQHAIRVIAHDEDNIGPLYVYLQSDIGQFLVKRNKSGSVIESIYEQDVSSLPYPHFPRALRSELTRLVKETTALRTNANALLDDVDRRVWRQAGIDASDLLDENAGKVFARPASSLWTEYEARRRIRLEATFQAPGVAAAEKLITRKGRWKRLREVVEGVPYTGPGTQPGVHKVTSQNGAPAITGRDLCLTRIRPAYYVASSRQQLTNAMIPRQGTTLVMCAGTLGATDYVRNNYEQWAVSLDVIRVVPNPHLLHPGYVYAFLSNRLGQVQMLRHKYGSVIIRIHSRQISEIMVPIPADNGEEIGEEVNKAFDNRAQARELEDSAIVLFMQAIQQGREATEAEWGKEY